MESRLARNHRFIGIVLILAVSVAFTAIQVRHSLVAGRLADPPTWDDVAYLDDAAIRLHELHTWAFADFLTRLVNDPPHSLYSAAMATVGFCLLGVHDWVPYAMNGVWLVVLLGSISSLVRRAAGWQWILLFVFVLTVPLAAILITEYRPDPAWGVSAAMAVFSVLRWRWVGSSRWHQIGTGLWFTAALMCKTSTFPLTLLTVGTAWLLALICDRAEHREAFTVRRFAATLFWASLPVLIIAMPYYVFERKFIFGYVYQTLLGPDRNHWIVRGTWLDRARYFLDGGGRVMLRNHFYLLILIIVVGGPGWIRNNLLRRDCIAVNRLRRGSCIAAITFIAYLVPAVNPTKNPFFGAEFEFLCLLSAVALIDALIESPNRFARLLGNGLLIATSLTGLACVRFPAPVGAAREPDTTRLVRLIISTVQVNSSAEPKVYLAVVGGRLNTSTLDYVSRQSGRAIVFSQPAYNATLTQVVENLDQYDFIVAGQTGAADLINAWPLDRLADQSLASIRADPRFVLAAQLDTSNKKRLLIFRHVRRL
jgi:hypothetical protein